MVFSVDLIIIAGFTAIVFFYSLSISILTINLNKTDKRSISKVDATVDVIIAFRNEEQNISKLIDALIKQSHYKCNIVLVDDHSTDSSWSIAVTKTKNNNRFQVLQLPPNLRGKKNALEYGINYSKGQYILFTDADCTINTNWVGTMVNEMYHCGIDLCSGTVLIHECNNILQKLQAIETLFLTAVGHALISCKKPVLCNGANLSVRRDQISTSLLNQVSSGDDIFRLQQMVKERKRIGYTTAKETQIFTTSEPTLLKMVQQKVRWVGKSKHYTDIFSMVFTVLIGLTQITTIFSFFMLPTKVWVSLWAVKILSEFILITKAMSVYAQKHCLFHIFSVGILYPFYSTIIAVISLFYKPQWKDRKVNV